MSAYRWVGLLASAAMMVGVGCAPRPVSMPRVNDTVVVSNANGLAAFDFGSGQLAFQAPSAIGSADWSRLYTTDIADSQLDVMDGFTGAHVRSVPIPTGLAPVTVSPDGSRVALAAPENAGTWQAGGSERSRIVTADTSGNSEPRTFELKGHYEPDAFSTDNQRLFVLEYQPSSGPDVYRVRQLDLHTGAVSGMFSRSKVPVPEEEMRGTRHSHVLSPDRHILYTLYTNQPEHLHSRDLARGATQSSGDTYAFVHVLNLLEGWAYCLDLPEPFGMGPASAHALALSPDGRWLYVADVSSGTVAVADAEQLVMRRVANVGADPSARNASAAVAGDGSLLLSDGSEILTIASRSLAVKNRVRIAGVPTGLAFSPDRKRLFVSTDNRLIALDPSSGSKLAEIGVVGTRSIQFVVSP